MSDRSDFSELITCAFGGSAISDGAGRNGTPPPVAAAAETAAGSTGLRRITARTEPTSVLSMHEIPISLSRGSRLRPLRPREDGRPLSSPSSSASPDLAIGVEVESYPFGEPKRSTRMYSSRGVKVACDDDFAHSLLLAIYT